MNELIEYKNTDNIVKDACKIIDSAQKVAYKAVNSTLVIRNWLLGKRICEEELKGEKRAEYGNKLISLLADELTKKYGKGFSQRSLYNCICFYKSFPRILQTLSAKFTDFIDVSTIQRYSNDSEDIKPVDQSLLSWSHYEKLMQVEDESARSWYEKEAYEQTWSVRTLQRNISSQYYYRMLKTQDKTGVENEMKELTSPYQDKLEFIKNPVIAEFLGMQENSSYYESDLEQSIISNLQKFLMELGKGYAFVARQQHIHTEKEDYYIDLVFYNYILKCFVLIDLKTTKITYSSAVFLDLHCSISTFKVRKQ